MNNTLRHQGSSEVDNTKEAGDPGTIYRRDILRGFAAALGVSSPLGEVVVASLISLTRANTANAAGPPKRTSFDKIKPLKQKPLTAAEIEADMDNLPGGKPEKLTRRNYKGNLKKKSLIVNSTSWCQSCEYLKPMLVALEKWSGGKLKTLVWEEDSLNKYVNSSVEKTIQRRCQGKAREEMPTGWPHLFTSNGPEKKANYIGDFFTSIFDMLEFVERDLGIKINGDLRVMRAFTLKYHPSLVLDRPERFPEESRQVYMDMAFEKLLKTNPRLLISMAPRLVAKKTVSKERILSYIRKHPEIANEIEHSYAKEFLSYDLGMQIVRDAAKAEPEDFARRWSILYPEAEKGFDPNDNPYENTTPSDYAPANRMEEMLKLLRKARITVGKLRSGY